jgi:hypothetical protein
MSDLYEESIDLMRDLEPGPVVVRLLSKDAPVRSAMAKEVISCVKLVPVDRLVFLAQHMAQTLPHNDPEVGEASAGMLARIATDAPGVFASHCATTGAVPALRAKLATRHKGIRKYAASALIGHALRSGDLAPAREVLEHPAQKLRIAGLSSIDRLRELDVSAAPLVDDLVAMLPKADKSLGKSIVRTLVGWVGQTPFSQGHADDVEALRAKITPGNDARWDSVRSACDGVLDRQGDGILDDLAALWGIDDDSHRDALHRLRAFFNADQAALSNARDALLAMLDESMNGPNLKNAAELLTDMAVRVHVAPPTLRHFDVSVRRTAVTACRVLQARRRSCYATRRAVLALVHDDDDKVCELARGFGELLKEQELLHPAPAPITTSAPIEVPAPALSAPVQEPATTSSTRGRHDIDPGAVDALLPAPEPEPEPEPQAKPVIESWIGLRITFTGTMKSGSRAELENLARAAMATVQSSVGKRTQVLVVGARVGQSKLDAARDHSVRVVSEAEFIASLTHAIPTVHGYLETVLGQGWDISYEGNEGDGFLEHIDTEWPSRIKTVRSALMAVARKSPGIRKHLGDYLEDARNPDKRFKPASAKHPHIGYLSPERPYTFARRASIRRWNDRRERWDEIPGSALLALLEVAVEDLTILPLHNAPEADSTVAVYVVGGRARSDGRLAGMIIQRVWT